MGALKSVKGWFGFHWVIKCIYLSVDNNKRTYRPYVHTVFAII